MSETVPYAEFQATNNALVADGGPWRTILPTEDLFCITGAKRDFCLVYGCITCNNRVASPVTSYSARFITNVSIPLSQYGSVNTLDFTFAYNLNWASDKTDAGTPLYARLSIGSYSKVDNFDVSDRAWLFSPPSTLGDPFTHSGTTLLIKSSDGLTGYIPIELEFPFSRALGSLCVWYFIAHSFRITTLPNSVSGSSPIATYASTSSLSSSSHTGGMTLSSLTLPGLTSQSISPSSSLSPGDVSVGSSSSSSSSNLTAHRSVPTAAILGGVLGGLFLLGVFTLMCFRLYRKALIKRVGDHPVKTNFTQGDDIVDGHSTRIPARSIEPFLGYPIALTDEIKALNSPSGRTGASPPPPSPPQLGITTHQSNAEIVNARSGLQGEDHRRRGPERDYRRHSSLSNLSTFRMDVPPPAYSDVDGRAESANGRAGGGNNDEEEGGNSHSEAVNVGHSRPQSRVVQQSTAQALGNRPHATVHSDHQRIEKPVI